MFKKISKLTAGLALAAVLLSSCAKDAELLDFTTTNEVSTSVQATDIVGTWDTEDNNGSVTFNENGSGSATGTTFASDPIQVTSLRNFTWILSQGAGNAQTLTIVSPDQAPSTITIESMDYSTVKFDGNMHVRSAPGAE